LGKIADQLAVALRERELLGAARGLHSRAIARGDHWSVEDVTCTFGPNDPSFEERHALYRIALVGTGTFLCRSVHGRELMTPGSLMLGKPGECFECGHEHGEGDRCLAFGYSPDYLDRLAADAGVRGGLRLRRLRVPPQRALAPAVAAACAAWADAAPTNSADTWESLAVLMATSTVRIAADPVRSPRAPLNAERGVARAVRLIDRDPRVALTLQALAREASLSPYHFLRTFARVTGVTPHQYLIRARLRRAAVRLATKDSRVIDVALDCGFRDVSTFNRAFRTEFGATPVEYRARARRRFQ
jgi:AraC family transcriptional regulator